MNLVSMKRDKEEKHDEKACDPCVSSDPPDYPYGARLYLEEDQLEKLGLKELPPAGTVLRLEGLGGVIGVREEQRDGKISRSLEIQITDLGLEAGPEKSLSEKLFDKTGA